MKEKNLWRQIEAWVKPIYLIVAFIILMTFGFCMEAKGGEVSMEVGGTFLSGEYSKGGYIYLQEEFLEKYYVGGGYISEQRFADRGENKHDVQENIFIQAGRNLHIHGPFSISLGAAYFNATNRALSSNLNFTLGVQFDIGDNVTFQIRHWSNGGSSRPNLGQDVIGFGWRFR
jgi:hypothetical protein